MIEQEKDLGEIAIAQKATAEKGVKETEYSNTSRVQVIHQRDLTFHENDSQSVQIFGIWFVRWL